MASDYGAMMWSQFIRTGATIPGEIEWSTWSENSNRYMDIEAMLEVEIGIAASYIAPPDDG